LREGTSSARGERGRQAHGAALRPRRARLVLSDAAGLDEVRKGILASGGAASTHVCNLADRADIAAVAARTLAECEHIDVLVDNAGGR
jgi:NAD(P)-dependent dehydrogenase (short-subunit alcohol dehydrogenase family)